jgi:hypothetical protein
VLCCSDGDGDVDERVMMVWRHAERTPIL